MVDEKVKILSSKIDNTFDLLRKTQASRGRHVFGAAVDIVLNDNLAQSIDRLTNEVKEISDKLNKK